MQRQRFFAIPFTFPFATVFALLLVASCSNPKAIPVEKSREEPVSEHPDAGPDSSPLTADDDEATGELDQVEDCIEPTDLVWRPANPTFAAKALRDLNDRLSDDPPRESLYPSVEDTVQIDVSCPTDLNRDGQMETIVRHCFNPENQDDCPSKDAAYFVEIAVYSDSAEGRRYIGTTFRAEENSGVETETFAGLVAHEGEVALALETSYDELPDLAATDCRRAWREVVRDDGLHEVFPIKWCAFDLSELHGDERMLEIRSMKDTFAIERVSGFDGLEFGDVITKISGAGVDSQPQDVADVIDVLFASATGARGPVTLQIRRGKRNFSATIGPR